MPEAAAEYGFSRGESHPEHSARRRSAGEPPGARSGLEPLGHRLVRARSGEEALSQVLEEEFCLALIDVQMAGMDGFETAALIKSHPRIAQTPIIFVTAISGDAKHVFEGTPRGRSTTSSSRSNRTPLRQGKVFVDLYMRGKKISEQDRLLRRRRPRRFGSGATSVSGAWQSRCQSSSGRSRRTASSGPATRRGGVLGPRATGDITDARFVHPDDLDRPRASARRRGSERRGRLSTACAATTASIAGTLAARSRSSTAEAGSPGGS